MGDQFKSIVAKLRADRPHVLFWSVGVDNNALEHATSPAGVGGLRCKDQADLMRWIRQALPSVRIVIAQEGGYAVQGGAAGSLPRSMYALVSRPFAFLLLPLLLVEGGVPVAVALTRVDCVCDAGERDELPGGRAVGRLRGHV